MAYTSPSPANIALNGNLTTWWIPATNTSTITATGVVVNVVVAPSNGLKLETWSTDTGSFNSTTGIWSIGTLTAGQTKWLRIVTRVMDIGLAPFTLTSTVSGNGIDSNNTNNTLVQNLTSVVTSVTAGAVADESFACGDVSLNDTACNYGVTEWRLTSPVVSNSTVYNWDVTTGKYKFIHDNPFLDIVTSYSIWCDPGTGFVEVSGPVTLTISKLFDSVTPWNHSSDIVEYAELSVEDIAYIETIPKYTSITLADYCWRTLRNAEGTLVGAEAVQCTGEQDTRHLYFCSESKCDPTPPTCTSCPNNQLPADAIAYLATLTDYTPELGDTIMVQFLDAYSYFTYEPLGWTRSGCSCVYKISQTAGNLITLDPIDNAPYLSAAIITDATDEKARVTANDTTSGFLNDKLIAGTGISFTVTNPGANEALVIAASAPPSTNVQVLDTCSINMGITGTGTVIDPFVISGTYNDGSVAPKFVTGIPGNTGETFDVSTLWGMACAAGCDPTYQIIDNSDNIFTNVSILGSTLTYDLLDYSAPGVFQFIIQRTCGSTKTISTLNVDISAQPVAIQLSEYASVYKDTQLFIDGSGPTKLDFGGTIINVTSGLTSSVPNDNFVATGSYIWDISYSGHLTFEIALPAPQRIIIAAYLDGVLVPESRQTVVVPAGTDYEIPFSKTWIQNINNTDTFDLRFDATVGDITAIDTVITLKQISYLI